MSPEVKSIGPYRIVGSLGKGGMGIVYRAVHAETGEAAAVKTVFLTNDALLDSIRREIDALARIRHPSIVRIIAHGVDSGRPWYAMELIPGRLLSSFLTRPACTDSTIPASRTESTTALQVPSCSFETTPSLEETSPIWAAARPGRPHNPGDGVKRSPTDYRHRQSAPLPWEGLATSFPEFLTIMRRLCTALSFLHGEGMVHRDLKPDNILITGEKIPVIIDFGLATQFQGRLSLALQQLSSDVQGTIQYIAPEMIQGRELDARADLYSLGCILYEILAGRPPFTGDARSILKAHLCLPAPPLSKVAPGLPVELYRVIERLLAKEPRERLGYASDVSAALTRMGAGDDYTNGAGKARIYVYRPSFHGREQLFAVICDRLDDLRGGHGAVIFVGGESGVGKTRFLLEVVRESNERGLEVLMGECIPDSRPFEALRRPLQRIADYCRRMGLAETERLFGARAKVLAVYDPELAELPGQDRHPPPPEESAKEALPRVFRCLSEALAELAKRKAVVLVLDDLQWADELTLGLLRFLHEERWFEQAPILVIASYRSEAAPPIVRDLPEGNFTSRIQLGRLSEPAVAAMVGDMLAVTPPPSVLGSFLWRHSEGNPFFVAEYLRMAVEQTVLIRDEAGSWKVPDSEQAHAIEPIYRSLPLPDSLRDLIEWRFGGLTAAASSLLAAAAVMGRESELEVIRKITAHLPDDEQLRALNELIRAQTLEEHRPGVLRFQHDKLREVSYDRLSAERRLELHRLAAGAIEALLEEDPDRIRAERRREEYAVALAMHYQQADIRDQALRYSRLAGHHAARALASADAIGHYENALRILSELPLPRQARLGLAVDLRLDLYNPRMHLYSAADDGMLRLCREAEPAAEELADPHRLVELYRAFSSCFFSRADYEHCVAYGRRCIALAKRLSEQKTVARAAYTVGVAYLQTGRIRSILEMAPPILTWLEETGPTRLLNQPFPPYITLSGALGVACTMRGEIDESDRWHRKSVDIGIEADHMYGLAVAHVLWGWSCYSRGDGVGCRSHGEETLNIAMRAGLPGPRMMGLYNAGVGAVLEGRIDAGIALLKEGLELSERLRYAALRTEAYYGLAQGYLVRDEFQQSTEACERGLDLGSTKGETKLEPEFHRLLAEIAFRKGEVHFGDAHRHLQVAISICDKRRMRFFAGRSLLLLGKLCIRQRKIRHARRALHRAGELFEMTAAQNWMKETDKELMTLDY